MGQYVGQRTMGQKSQYGGFSIQRLYVLIAFMLASHVVLNDDVLGTTVLNE